MIADGHTLGESNLKLPAPQKLHWDFTPNVKAFVDECYLENKEAVKDIDSRLLFFKEFGKGFMKTVKCSPDGFLQLALQLAYFRDVGEFHLTYEASMTRLYLEGRTETVRSCTNDSTAFVRAFCESPRTASKEDLKKLLYKSVRAHQDLYRDCMSGKGVDRHLFCLYVLARYMKVRFQSGFYSQDEISGDLKMETICLIEVNEALMNLNRFYESPRKHRKLKCGIYF